MKILIIGNGFDLAHGLPTKYTDFLERTRKFFAYRNGVSPDSELGKSFSDALLRNGLYDEFCEVEDNVWLEHFINRYERNLLKDNTWIDFENEVKYVVEKFEKMLSSRLNSVLHDANSWDFFPKKFRDSSPEALKSLNSATRIPAFSNFMLSHLKQFTRAFEIYCLCVINEKTRNNSMRVLTSHDFDAVLSFNYTNTFETLYGNDKIKFCYIHGKAQPAAEKTNMIFGIDETLSDGKESTFFTFARFKKYFQRILYKTGSEYKDWIRDIGRTGEKCEIYILGHSLGSTDHEVLKEFFKFLNYAKITIFYHDPISEIQAIEKVIEMIGKDNLTQRVHGSNWTIRFANQYDKNIGIMRHLKKEA